MLDSLVIFTANSSCVLSQDMSTPKREFYLRYSIFMCEDFFFRLSLPKIVYWSFFLWRLLERNFITWPFIFWSWGKLREHRRKNVWRVDRRSLRQWLQHEEKLAYFGGNFCVFQDNILLSWMLKTLWQERGQSIAKIDTHVVSLWNL